MKELAVDANILLRAAFGGPVHDLIVRYADLVEFRSPDLCFVEARRNIPGVAAKRHLDEATAFLVLERLESIVRIVDRASYHPHQGRARERIRARDLTDWPIVAVCLLLDAPLWTENRYFFGCGIATWTTKNVGIYLRDE